MSRAVLTAWPIAMLAFASAGCVPPSQMAELRDDMTTLRGDVDELRATAQRQAEEIRSLRALVESAATASQENKADLQLRLRSIEERQDASIEQADQSRERLESLAADIAALRSQFAARGVGGGTAESGNPPGATPAGNPPGTAPSNSAPATAVETPVAGGSPVTPPAPETGVESAEGVPEAVQDLFNAAYADYSKGRYSLAIRGFEEIVRVYGQTDLADNARYWIGVSRLDSGDGAGAVAEFDRLLRDYPEGDRVAPALLKKGLALLEIDRREAGITELRALVSRFPASEEARVARGRLASLGVKAG